MAPIPAMFRTVHVGYDSIIEVISFNFNKQFDILCSLHTHLMSFYTPLAEECWWLFAPLYIELSFFAQEMGNELNTL